QVQALPALLSRVGAGAGALGEAIELYRACVAFVCDSPGAEVVPLLSFVARNGNTSVFRWRTGLEPRRVERPEPPRAPEPPREDTVGPGGDTGEGDRREPRIAPLWGGFWGGGGGGDVVAGQEGVFFGLPRGVIRLSRFWGSPRAPPDTEGVARGSDALTLLENAETRNQFIDELMELELFLEQRLLELEDEADVVAMSQLQLAPPVLQGQSGDRVRAQLATVRELLAQLCSRSVQHLCMILASPRC
ncbi:CK5P3 protein, partial [Pteruthius melanotis]|nr:CK5P3 protein [Pteruthius melanotis]